MKSDRNATLAMVAKIAGVSSPTVSKVLNGRDDVAEATRIRVQYALDSVGYESPVQRRIRAEGPPLVDFVCEGLSSAYAIEVLRGVVDHAATENIEIVLSQATPAMLRETDHEEWAARLIHTGRKGLILVTSEMSADQVLSFQRRGIPVVVIDPRSPIKDGVVSIGATNWAGGKLATDHLLDLGHTKIAYIGGPESAECHVARLHGYLAALRGRGIEPVPDYETGGSFQPVTGVEGLAAFAELADPPTAIFASSDTIALGVIEEARRRGINVPQDLSLVGFDGTYLSEQSMPRLTTVSQPLQDMGRTALRSVLRLMAGDTLESDHVELATKLIIRDSSATPRQP